MVLGQSNKESSRITNYSGQLDTLLIQLNIKQEMLIIWGEFDQIFPLEKAYKVKE